MLGAPVAQIFQRNQFARNGAGDVPPGFQDTERAGFVTEFGELVAG